MVVGRRALLLALPGAGVYLATSAAAGFALEGSVERTLAAAGVACLGLAGAAYGPTLLGALHWTRHSPFPKQNEEHIHKPNEALRGPEQQQQEAGGGEKEGEEGFAAFQRSYLAVQLLATFIDFLQGPYLYKAYAGTYGLATVRPCALAASGANHPQPSTHHSP